MLELKPFLEVQMSTWILLMCGIFLLSLSIWTLYNAYTPKVGPIGNGPNYIAVWVWFIIQFLLQG